MTETTKVIKTSVTLGKATKETVSGGLAVIIAMWLAGLLADKVAIPQDALIVTLTAMVSGAFKVLRNITSEVLRRYGVDPTVLT